MFDSQKLAVFVPATTTGPIASVVAMGSAIVGPVGSDEAEVTVYYEGNLLGYTNVKTYADRASVDCFGTIRRSLALLFLAANCVK